MKSIAALITLCCASAGIGQTTPDIHDTVCIVYRLDSIQESQFGPHDGALAPFWDEWDIRNAQELTLDYIEMIPELHAQPGRDYYTGPEDNTLLVKAACGTLGLYLLVEMIDDDFLDRDMGNTDSIHRDVIELFIDTLSSRENRDLGAAVYVGLYDATLTHTSVQFVLSMGRDRVYDNFRIAYYSPILWSWQPVWVQFAEAEQLFDGMAFETVPLSATRRAQEWFLPWSWVGTGGPAEYPPAQGRRFAFAGGCHDMDSAQEDTVCSLKWKNRGNPWAPKVDDKYNDTWGDLEIGPPLPATVSARTGRQTSPKRPGAALSGPVVRFSLTGARLPEPCNAAPAAGLVVERTGGGAGRASVRVSPVVARE